MALKAIMSDNEDEKAQFLYEIPNGLQTDDLVEIRGFTMGGAKSIGMEFSTRESVKNEMLVSEKQRKVVPFRLMLRIGGEWEATGYANNKERHFQGRANTNFKAASDFCIRVVCQEDHFQVLNFSRDSGFVNIEITEM